MVSRPSRPLLPRDERAVAKGCRAGASPSRGVPRPTQPRDRLPAGSQPQPGPGSPALRRGTAACAGMCAIWGMVFATFGEEALRSDAWWSSDAMCYLENTGPAADA